jgi:hypothetical protein
MRFSDAERWPSGRRHQIANLASWVTGIEGSNPSLSAKVFHLRWGKHVRRVGTQRGAAGIPGRPWLRASYRSHP